METFRFHLSSLLYATGVDFTLGLFVTYDEVDVFGRFWSAVTSAFIYVLAPNCAQ